MPIAQSDLEAILRKNFPLAKIAIIDLVGDNDHYRLEISDKNFVGKSRMQQHKMVNAALGEILGTTLHALQIITLASND